jgi:hypothetical protein
VIDLLRILDYPADFVPAASRHREAAPAPTTTVTATGAVKATATPPLEAINVVDKSALDSPLGAKLRHRRGFEVLRLGWARRYCLSGILPPR